MAQLLSGREVAGSLCQRLSGQVKTLQAAGVQPCLAILRVGRREDDLSYERSAIKRCQGLDILTRGFVLEAGSSQQQLEAVLEQINQDPDIHGCLMFRPLPAHLDEARACRLLDPAKDCDGITDLSLLGVLAQTGQGYPPCTAQAVLEILDHYNIPVQGKRVTVIGRSLVVGKPLAMLLLARHATVTICHTRTLDLPGRCREAEILIAAAGAAHMVDGSCLAPGQIVIDVGVNFTPEGRLVGDVCFDQAEPLVQAIAPVPGGVGAVTTAVLAKQVILAAAAQNSISL